MAVLALLIDHAPHSVPVTSLVNDLIRDDQPDRRTRRDTLKKTVSRLREELRDEIPSGRSGSYALRDPDGRTDVHQFEVACDAARAALDHGDRAEAVRLWSEALDLWHGTIPLQDLQQYEFARAFAAKWLGVRRDAVDALAGVLRELGRPREAERLLDREKIRRLPVQVNQPRTAAGTGEKTAPEQTGAGLIGRAGTVDRLRSLIEGMWESDDPGPHVIRISGQAGVGVTAVVDELIAALSPAWVRRIDMRGTRRKAATAERALVQLLDELGRPADELPPQRDARIEMYARLVASVPASRRLMLVLDHVSHAEQVLPLIPPFGTPATVLICGRPDLTEIQADESVEVPPLDRDSAVEVLRRTVGSRAVNSDLGAARKLVWLCDHVPQFVLIVGASAVESGQTLAECVATIEARRLHNSDLNAADVLDVLDYSARDLTEAQRDAFALIGRLDADTLPVDRAAALLDLDRAATTDLLTGLLRAKLVSVDLDNRYVVPPILAGYARQLPCAHSWPAALRRAIDQLLAETREVAAQLRPDATHPAGFARLGALDWYEAEDLNLAGAVEQAAAEGVNDLCWRIVDALTPVLFAAATTADWSHLVDLALTSAQRLDDPTAKARILMSRAELRRYLGELAASYDDYDAAVTFLNPASQSGGPILPASRAAADDSASVDLARALDGRADLGLGLAVTTKIDEAEKTERMRAAKEDAERSHALFTAAGDRGGAASALATIGEHCALSDRPADAIEPVTTCLELYRAVPDPVHEAVALRILGSVYYILRDLTRANEMLHAALDVNRRIGAKMEEARTLVKLAQAADADGRADLARGYYETALRILERRQDLMWRAAAKMHYGALLLRERPGDPAGVAHLTAARAIFERIADSALVTRCNALLGELS